jgi:hypothetical protein
MGRECPVEPSAGHVQVLGGARPLELAGGKDLLPQRPLDGYGRLHRQRSKLVAIDPRAAHVRLDVGNGGPGARPEDEGRAAQRGVQQHHVQAV